ncbi:MAG TPA: energy transducer TonB [Flavobacteriales bacterium]|nr:energy transducer TonB [Flavobacteriales bacterium]
MKLGFIVPILLIISASKNGFTQANDKVIGCEVPKVAEFPGGNVALQTFLHEFICYPETGSKDSIQGKVFIEFTIDSIGNVVKPKIKRGLRPDFDSICLSVFEFMPRWIPSEDSNGKKVDAKFILPFNFRFSQKDDNPDFFTEISCTELELKKRKLRDEKKKRE